ncbi:hypothetical protein GF385_04090 [Candidatus Dependentiae bacterium]|nr:hypothetical protein [Candidatus Dependentiae bacterium]
MNKLLLRIFVLLSFFSINNLKPNYRFTPKNYITSSSNNFYSKKLIEYKIKELQLLLKYYPYLVKNLNQNNSLNPLLFNTLFNISSQNMANKKDDSKIDNSIKKNLGKKVINVVGFGLNTITRPIRNGVSKGFENLVTKITSKSVPLLFGCTAYWLFFGRDREQSFLLPITTTYSLIKKFVLDKPTNTNSSLRKFDTTMKKSWNWVANRFGKGKKNLVLNKQPNKTSLKPGFDDKALALAFLLLANYIF